MVPSGAVHCPVGWGLSASSGNSGMGAVWLGQVPIWVPVPACGGTTGGAASTMVRSTYAAFGNGQSSSVAEIWKVAGSRLWSTVQQMVSTAGLPGTNAVVAPGSTLATFEVSVTTEVGSGSEKV